MFQARKHLLIGRITLRSEKTMTDQELLDNLIAAQEMNKLAQDNILFGEITGEIDTNMLVKNGALQGFVKGVFCERFGFNIVSLEAMIEFVQKRMAE
jgi:hypothetical protein